MRQFMLDVIFDELDKHEDMNTNISSLAKSLLENYINDGTYTYNKQESVELIKKYWDDIADMYYDYTSLEDINPFIDPEGFFVYIMVEYAEKLMNEVVITSDNFILDNEHIEYIKNELCQWIKNPSPLDMWSVKREKRRLLSWKAQINILEQIQEHWYIQNEQKEERKEKAESSIKNTTKIVDK